jgi:hypothetical protein
MNDSTLPSCRWCGELITAPKRGQKFCCARHRYLWHQNQRISPARLDERIRAIVREEIKLALATSG